MNSETKLKLLIFIVPKKNGEKLNKELSQRGFGFQTAALGVGTAKSETLSILGIDEPERVVFYLLGESSVIYRTLRDVSAEFRFEIAGNGVGMILPLTAICSQKALGAFLGNGMLDVPHKTEGFFSKLFKKEKGE